MKTGNVRRRALLPLGPLTPLIVAALLLAGSPGAAAAAPAAPELAPGAGVVEWVWERVWGWVREMSALLGEEGSMIDPDGAKAPTAKQGSQTQSPPDTNGAEATPSR